MINLLLGQPGGGKSYEAVAFHILPALAQGRKVITNMPLDLEHICSIDTSYRALISLRQNDVEIQKEVSRWNLFHRSFDTHTVNQVARPFATMLDYADPWRHPETGAGPLYVIDECHKALPRGKTDQLVEEWFAEHRHEFADVLLITQSYGKISAAIVDLVQVCYRVKKATAFGTNKSYIRKVLDGVRGEVVNESIRTYNPTFFRFYKSHTRSDSAGKELAASDIKPIWMRWPFLGAAVCLVLVLGILMFSNVKVNPISNAQSAVASGPRTVSGVTLEPYTPSSASASVRAQASPTSAPVRAPASPAVVHEPAPSSHPFSNLRLHIVGYVQSGDRDRYSFSASQSGMHQFYVNSDELKESGYTVKRLSDCSALISFEKIRFYASCDSPVQGFTGTAQVVGL